MFHFRCCYRTGVLTGVGVLALSPGGLWQCLEAFLVVITQGRVRVYCYLVGRGQEDDRTSYLCHCLQPRVIRPKLWVEKALGRQRRPKRGYSKRTLVDSDRFKNVLEDPRPCRKGHSSSPCVHDRRGPVLLPRTGSLSLGEAEGQRSAEDPFCHPQLILKEKW